MAPPFQSYHNATAAQHQAYVTQLSAEGFNPISLSVYGDPSNALYAAVWVKGPSPSWLAVHNIDANAYQNWITTTVEPQGYRVVIVSFTGSGSNLVFAAVALKDSVGWMARHGMTNGGLSDPNSFQSQCQDALNDNMILRSLSIYGTAAARTYAATWEANAGNIQWSFVMDASASYYQNYFDAAVVGQGRPAYTAMSSDGLCAGYFRNDWVGPWVARTGLSSTDYQSLFNELNSQGYYPICVQGGGTTAKPVFAAVFVQQTTIRRVWAVTGQPVAAALTQFDDAMANFMQTYGVRAAQLSILHNGELEFSHAYTWGEQGYAITQPTSVFRLASCSKAFTCAAINTLGDAGKLVLGSASNATLVFPTLGITEAVLASQTPSPYINQITVQELVDHAGGWNDTVSGFDPVFNLRAISQALGLPRPPRKLEVAQYMYGEPLQFPPGTQNFNTNPKNYSNFGYLLLGLIIEAVSGMPYVDYVRQNVLAPLGLYDVYLSRMTAGPLDWKEVSYDDPQVGPTPFDWTSSAFLPNAYGGEGDLTDIMDSGGGLMTSALTLATFIHNYAVWGLGGRAPGSTREGSMDGTLTWAESRSDGVDWALLLNSRWQLGQVVGTYPNGNPITVFSRFVDSLNGILNGVNWPHFPIRKEMDAADAV
jgi:CubicO group peptidase (beta-lactamase class C family)